ncbi:hypothetical protein [Streptomyces sp. NPDC058579]|uniref:hypothetical protein n=1 Tax=Streptomyces sp. NPDC058579 TaxID=3346548 RepID=UPI003663960D
MRPIPPSRVRVTMTAYVRFATENAALLELMCSSKHRPGATCVVKAAEAPFGRMGGQEQGALQGGDPERIGIVLFATLQGMASTINSDFVPADLLDSLVETAVEQFLRGARPLS